MGLGIRVALRCRPRRPRCLAPAIGRRRLRGISGPRKANVPGVILGGGGSATCGELRRGRRRVFVFTGLSFAAPIRRSSNTSRHTPDGKPPTRPLPPSTRRPRKWTDCQEDEEASTAYPCRIILSLEGQGSVGAREKREKEKSAANCQASKNGRKGGRLRDVSTLLRTQTRRKYCD